MLIIKLQSTKGDERSGSCWFVVYFSNCSSAAQGVEEADLERDLDC